MQIFKSGPHSFLWPTGILFIIIFFTAAPVVQEGPDNSQGTRPVRLISSLRGSDLFQHYCASCHGTDGSGNGPVSPALITKVPDLTTIAQRNGGIFPTRRIRNIVAGDEVIVSHGSREMPVWGPIFHQIEEDRDLGEVRLQNVTKYLESMQKK